jgi:hypothetical protein
MFLICVTYNFNALRPVVWITALTILCVFLRIVTKMSDQFLEQRINTKFCVGLGNNESNIFAMLSEACGGEAM